MIKVTLTNEILNYITEIDKNRYEAASVRLPGSVANKLRKNSKKRAHTLLPESREIRCLKNRSIK